MEKIRTITFKDKEYPKILKKIPDPPKTLYVKGVLSMAQKPCFAVVGTRRCSDYGKQAALEITSALAEAGLIIVSGMAKGIDTLAHQSCLEQKTKTIAVLGTGIDEKSIYPQENIKLAKKIVGAGGAVISEFPCGTPGYKGNFPLRNRIISGLCLGVLVIEAKYRSGALITAHHAFKQKRKVFALPGPIHSLNSQGPNDLIKQGAKLVDRPNDILKELNLTCLRPDLKQGEKGENKEENLILNCLKEGALNINEIIENTKLPASIVAGALSVLEIKNKLRNLGGNVYAPKR
jgi:DNA processing protein